MSVTVVNNTKLPFPAYEVRAKQKSAMRAFVAKHGCAWLRLQHARKATGAVMLDIDDTLITGNETVKHGFQFMKEMYDEASRLFPVHIVTARPDYDHARCLEMLHARGFHTPPDRVHMLPGVLYDKGTARDIEEFKWNTFLCIARAHRGVVARFGDKMWDVAHLDTLRHGPLATASDGVCLIFRDPKMNGTLSYKLPGRAE